VLKKDSLMPPDRCRLPERSAAQGFSLLEVMIALLIVSVGLLGLAGLQALSLKNNVSASQRTIATQLAYDMADRMRANAASVLSGDYNYATYSATNSAGQTTAACLTTTGCSATQLAQEDLYEWNQQICAQLPQSTACNAAGPWGVVCIDSTPNDGTPTAPACDNAAGAPYAIKIWWLEDRNNPTLLPKQWVTSVIP
jgi:type IV pilus assembly protein PilV